MYNMSPCVLVCTVIILNILPIGWNDIMAAWLTLASSSLLVNVSVYPQFDLGLICKYMYFLRRLVSRFHSLNRVRNVPGGEI